MAKKPEGRTFNISVIGLSGGEKEKGIYGVGKSCLCNRFIYQVEDKYYQEHISVLSQSDFGGRVINNDHFLYWGDVTKTDEGNNFTFHVIEQTEFIDDVSFTPFKTGRTDPYVKRCVQTKVQSAEKLMYICKDQLGMETDSAYEQKLMPDGKLTIDGILCCFDVSKVPDRNIDKQVEVCIALLTNALKSKKPVVLATTKNDAMDEDHIREVEKILMKKEFKSTVHLVETSALENVNIETAFILLAHLIDKSKTRTKVLPYSDAAKARKEICDVAKEAFKNLLKNKIPDHKITWTNARKKLEKESDYQHYVDLFGTDQARLQVRQHTRQLREEIVKKKQNLFLKRLPDVFNHFFPDLETVGDRRSWSSCQERMMRDPDFEQFFVQVCEPGESWTMVTEFIDNVQESRIPMDILDTKEAADKFRAHFDALLEVHKKESMKKEFWALLEKHIDIPGGLLSDNYTKFFGKECYTGLQDYERQRVYDEFQQQLQSRLRNDFQELLWEHPSLFRSLNYNKNVTEHDLNVIYNSLNDDQRFRKFMKLDDIRKVMLLNHVVFLEKPTVKSCFFHNSTPDVCLCTECQTARILHDSQHIPNGRLQVTQETRFTGPIVSPLNLVLLGQDGLATELSQEIRNRCIDDEYRVSRHVYKLDYRPIEGDVSEEHNSFILPNFKPHGCICVYDSQESLEYIRSSILKTLEANLSKDNSKALEGLPIVVMLAYEPYTVKELDYLRENGKLLARSLQCEFVDIPEEDLAEKLKFYPEQMEQAFSAIITGPGKSIGHKIMEQTEPDLRILMCMMCSDPFPMHLPLQPFLNEGSFTVTSVADTGSSSPEEENVFTFDANLDCTKQKIEVTVTSYHGAQVCVNHGEIYHGFILVYCPKRKASLASLRAFAEPISPQYFLILAVPEEGGRSYNLNEHSRGLKEGKELAKCLQAGFMEISPSFQHFGAMHPQVYEKFLKKVWEHRDDVDDDDCDEPSPPPAYDPQYRRPPAPLPNQIPNNKSTSSNSQSTEDSEPLYDQPHIIPPVSDNERASPSPPPLPNSVPPPAGPDTEIFFRNDNALVKPSMLKEKRSQYAGPLRDQYRKSFPAVETERFKLSSSMSQSMTEHLDAEAAMLPKFQFRKSRSMKLAVKDEVEAWAINEPKKHLKSSTFPASSPRALKPNESPYEETEWTDNAMYDHSGPYRPSNLKQRYGIPQLTKSSSKGGGAPLAMPEKIEISEVYGTVKDALYTQDSDYALVDDALPHGKIHRIKSTSKKNEKGTDSEESEFSSLERDKESKDLYSKVNRKPTPHKKKNKHRHPKEDGRSNSPSEDSTGDELQTGRKEKRRSLKKKITSPENVSANLSDSEISSPMLQGGFEDDDRETSIHKIGDDPDDMNESINLGTWFKKKTGKDTLREKRIKDEERRKRDLGKKQKEQQKLQKKIKKKDSKAAGQSESGISLSDFAMSPNNPSVPHFIEKCVEFIEAEGLHAEGIYRVPGNKAQSDLLTQKYNEDSNTDISTLDIQVNAVATVLKAFFADLSDPLVPVALYDELIEASDVQDKSARVSALRGVFLKMHPLNFEVLKFLITHLHKVSKNSEHNNMDSKNLSICWWPTLIRMEFDTIDKFTKYSRIPGEILQTLIEQCSFFFHSGNEI